MGTFYNPPVKHFFYFNYINWFPLLINSARTSPLVWRFLFRRVSLLSANSLPDRYVYPTSEANDPVSIIPYPGFEFRERPSIVPPGVIAPTFMNELSRRTIAVLKGAHHAYTSNSEGLNSESVFIIVQAITSILTASLTRIFVFMPLSFSRPLR